MYKRQQLSEALTGGSDGIKDWKDAEAAYFCMKALADQPPQHCNPRLLQARSTSYQLCMIDTERRTAEGLSGSNNAQ